MWLLKTLSYLQTRYAAAADSNDGNDDGNDDDDAKV